VSGAQIGTSVPGRYLRCQIPSGTEIGERDGRNATDRQDRPCAASKSASVIFGFLFFLISLLPIIIVITVLLRVVRTLEAISADVRRIADGADSPARDRSPK